MSYQCHIQTQRLGSDQRIQRADRRALLFQCSTDHPVCDCSAIVEIDNDQWNQKLFQGLLILINIAALLHTTLQLGNGN